ncbi:nucleotidyltransferase [Brevibacillus porteri]|uniref:SMODS domain-containing nucleotidyltransferase n=1 Tax=Brevibacillus porteri TaxID=2126350 RepID=UPI0036430D36
MSVLSYLDELSSKLVIKEEEKIKISTSNSTLSSRISSYFDGDISDQFTFGSYTRGTILPRKADSTSDIDYMIVFKNPNNYKPQTFLIQLKGFVGTYYQKSEIYQSFPTIALELQHIKFELVPATKDWLGSIRIPSPSNVYEDWLSTDPNGFNNQLTQKNQSCNNKIKPMIRLMKYWNARNGYIFSSYMLEKHITEQCYLFCNSLKDYLFRYISSSLTCGWSAPKTTKDKIDRAKQIIMNVNYYENAGRYFDAESEIKKLLPEI